MQYHGAIAAFKYVEVNITNKNRNIIFFSLFTRKRNKVKMLTKKKN